MMYIWYVSQPRVMSFHLLAKSVFPFLELTSELNANSGKFAFFTLNEFNLNDFRQNIHNLQIKKVTVILKTNLKLPVPMQDKLKELVSIQLHLL